MKSLEELEKLRKSALGSLAPRQDKQVTRIVVGMATCGIAAGARPVLTAFMDEVQKRQLKDVIVSQTGCIGMCRLEPIVEVYKPGEEKVTYVRMTPALVSEVMQEHITRPDGKPVFVHTLDYSELQNG